MKFSVVIPVYNVAPWLRACLDSVLAQTSQDWEAVCVDDGSTDGSGTILDEYAARDRRFRALHQRNRGVSAARNAALDVVQGEWICFLDGDDLYAPEMLAAGAQLVVQNPDCDLVRVWSSCFRDGSDPQTGQQSNAGLLSGAFWTGFYRRSAYADARFPDFVVGEDRVYAATCVFRTGKVVESDYAGYLYRQRATSISHVAMTLRKAQDGFLHVAEMLKIAAANGRTLEPSFRRQLVAQVLEEGAANWRRLPRADQRTAESCWRNCIAELRKDGLLTPWGNLVAAALRLLPFGATVSLLCVLPHRLKKAGVHR